MVIWSPPASTGCGAAQQPISTDSGARLPKNPRPFPDYRPCGCVPHWRFAERPGAENVRLLQTGHLGRSHYKDVVKELFAS